LAKEIWVFLSRFAIALESNGSLLDIDKQDGRKERGILKSDVVDVDTPMKRMKNSNLQK